MRALPTPDDGARRLFDFAPLREAVHPFFGLTATWMLVAVGRPPWTATWMLIAVGDVESFVAV